MDTYSKMYIVIIIVIIIVFTIIITKLEIKSKRVYRRIKDVAGYSKYKLINHKDSDEKHVKNKHSEECNYRAGFSLWEKINIFCYMLIWSVLYGGYAFLSIFIGGVVLGIFGIVFSIGGIFFDCWAIFDYLPKAAIIGAAVGVILGACSGWDKYKEKHNK